MSNDDYGGEGYCNDCYDDEDNCDCGECGYGGDEGIRRWGDTPDLRFHDVPFIGPSPVPWMNEPYNRVHVSNAPAQGKYYLGMEIEVEDVSAHVVGSFVTRHSERMWATTDATIDNGFEIVTMPMTYGAWMETFPWDEWTNDIHNRVPDQSEYDSNGIHIHVSRAAFADAKGRPLASHLYKFMQFIRKHESAIQYLSERQGGSYCMWDQQRDARDSVKDAKSTNNYERYRPVNTQNRQTIELRFFDGRSDPTFMKRSLMFVHSLVEYTRHGKAHDKRTWEAYTTYVSDHADLYPELQAYFVSNRRRLLACALTSEFRYTDTVLPIIKRRKEQQRRELIEERNREARIRRERERAIELVDVTCQCVGCQAYAQRTANDMQTLDDGRTIMERATVQAGN
jgi:hypothetical protein